MAAIHHGVPLTNVWCQPPRELPVVRPSPPADNFKLHKMPTPALSLLSGLTETNFPSFDPSQSPSFCLLGHDWWWDRSVFNQRYLEPLKSWNEMFLLSITISSSAGPNEEYISSNSINCKTRKYWLTFSESDISISFSFSLRLSSELHSSRDLGYFTSKIRGPEDGRKWYEAHSGKRIQSFKI